MPKRSYSGPQRFIGPLQATASGSFYGKKGFRKRARKYTTRPRMVASAARNDADKKWVAIKDIKSVALTGSSHILGSCGLHDLQDAPAFKRYSTLYGKVRVKKIKITFNEGIHSHQVITAVSSMDNDQPAGMDYLLRQSTLATHNLGQSAGRMYPAQRTFNLWEANRDFMDWCDTSSSHLDATFGTAVSDTDPNSLKKQATKKAVIKYGFTQQSAMNGLFAHLTVEYLCEFCNLQDVGVID